MSLSVHVTLAERDVVKLILDFLQQRQLFISMLDIERETGIINGSYSEDILFLRQLILDGQWDDVIDFVQPLKTIDIFDAKQFIYLVLKHQFLELLCLKTESQIENDVSVEQIVKFLNDLHPFVPNEQEYKKLSFLLTLKHLYDHPDYHNWNPSAGRIQCFQEIFPLVHRFLQVEKPNAPPSAQNDRLVQLLVKGLLYESSVEHCQARATNTDETIDISDPNTLLLNTRLSDTDVSLLSWLHALPTDIFSCPFEQKSLALNIDKFQKPILEGSWAEHVLSTPFKPQTMFPFNATPTGKSRSTELMTRSLAPQFEGLSYGLIRSQIFGDHNRNLANDLSRSIATCNLKENGNHLPTVEEVLHEETPPPPPPSKENGHSNDLLKEYQKTRAINEITKYDSLEMLANTTAFIPLVSLEDVQAIRSVDIHPSGKYFAVGSNSKMIRVCAYPDLKTDSVVKPAKVLYKKGKHHLGSIYCMSWSSSGKMLATGSNDKLIKVVKLDMDRPEDELNNTEIELTHHNGTIRDLIFMQDEGILLSGGAGDCAIYMTDVKKQTVVKNFPGHQGHVYSIFTWDSHNFASASEDGTVRLWDTRQSDCVNLIPPRSGNSPVAAVAVDGSGQLLSAGYEDTSCLLYDIRGKRTVQAYQPHTDEIRSVRFSVHSYYLLSASYDRKVAMTNLNGDLTKPLVLTTVATHTDKIIQARWHPTEMSFATTSADRTCVIWAPSPSTLAQLS